MYYSLAINLIPQPIKFTVEPLLSPLYYIRCFPIFQTLQIPPPP